MSAVRATRLLRLRLVLACAASLPLLGGCSETDLLGAHFVTTPVTSVEAGEEYSYAARSAGVQPSLKTYTLLTAPAGMTVSASGLVSWTPTFAELGIDSVRLQVSDGEHTDVQSWDITVHQDLLFGVNYSPLGHTGSTTQMDESDFAAEHKDFGKLVGYMGNWRDSEASAGTIPSFASAAMVQAASSGFVPVIGFRWADSNGAPDLTSDGITFGTAPNSWANQETRDEFLMMVEGFASTYAPRYLYLGYEVNTWSLANPGHWPDWLSQLEECTEAIKAVSPNTFVFTTFQYEHMQGLGENQGWVDADQWTLVDDLESGAFLDGVGFTSYPHFEYDTPALIPADYYDEIGMHWTGQILFPELGWPAVVDGAFPGSPTQQDDMMSGFMTRIEGLPIELAMWLYLHDFDGQAGTPGFMDIGMRSNDGMVVRPSEATWKTATDLRERP